MTSNEERDPRDPFDPPFDPMQALLERMERVEPPADFVARVMVRARQSDVARWRRWQRLLFGAGYLAALVLLAVLAFLTGSELEHAGARDLISLAIHDVSLVTDSPGIYLTALRDAIPWTHVLLVLADAVALAVATRFVLKVATPPAEANAVRV
jgi:hypothetical protein